MPNAFSWTFFLHCAGVQPETLRPRCWAVWAVYLCTAQAGYFLSKKSKKKFASSQAEKSGYNKKNLNWTSFGVAQVYLFSIKNIEIRLNVVVQVFSRRLQKFDKIFHFLDGGSSPWSKFRQVGCHAVVKFRLITIDIYQF